MLRYLHIQDYYYLSTLKYCTLSSMKKYLLCIVANPLIFLILFIQYTTVFGDASHYIQRKCHIIHYINVYGSLCPIQGLKPSNKQFFPYVFSCQTFPSHLLWKPQGLIHAHGNVLYFQGKPSALPLDYVYTAEYNSQAFNLEATMLVLRVIAAH